MLIPSVPIIVPIVVIAALQKENMTRSVLIQRTATRSFHAKLHTSWPLSRRFSLHLQFRAELQRYQT